MSDSHGDLARYRQARDVFDELRETDPADWDRRVPELAGGDAEVARRARALLEAHRDDPDFLEQPRRIGPYRILERIGEGGMGIVYRAEREDPHREAALKVVGFRSEEVVRRFSVEQQALARMNHPNIAQVYETGTTNGRWPYLAMELVDGEPITAYCRRHDLSLERRLALFVSLCRGVEHAHRNGIIHRDLKPSNVLVTPRDGEAVPKLIDFGIAKAIADAAAEQPRLTRTGFQPGTLAYMSPEQLDGKGVDVRSDIYALGVMLYEMIAGVLPFPEDRDRDPLAPPPRPSVRLGNIEWIALKALDPDPDRRYESVAALADDVSRFLRGEEVSARREGTAERMWRTVKRHRLSLSVAGIVAAAVVVGAASWWESRRAEAALQREVELIGQFAETVTALVVDTDPRGQAIRARDLLDRTSAGVIDKLARHPELEIKLRRQLGNAYRRRGLYPEAQRHLELALERAEQVLPRTSPTRTGILNALANVHSKASEYETAAGFYREALDNLRAESPGSEDLAAVQKNLADCYAQLGRPEEALELLQSTFAIRKRLGNRKGTWITLTSIGDTERRMGRVEEAIETLSSALGLREEDLAADDPKLGHGYYKRARAYLDADDPARARQDLEKTASIWTDAYPEGHPDLAAVLRDLARCCVRAGDHGCAERRFLEGLAVERKIAGDDPKYLIDLMEDYAEFLDAQERSDDAAAVRLEIRGLRKDAA